MLYRRIVFLLVFAMYLAIAVPVSAADDERTARTTQGYASERAGVEAAIGQYFEGHATGDCRHMREAFLPSAHIEGIRSSEFTSWTLDQYCAFFDGEPPADESERTRKIDLIDVSGDAAIARATLTQPNAVITDYFVLLKVDGEWRIANKVYAFEDPEAG